MLHCVIMAGGSGTRFWPESRQTKPKQLLSICGQKSMIRATVDRIAPLVSPQNTMIVAAQVCAEQIRCEIPELTPEKIIEEPLARNTAPCIALAAYKVLKQDPEAVMAVLPADHLIGDEETFRTIIKTACDVAFADDRLITLGVVPNRPETGYGYLKLGAQIQGLKGVNAFQVQCFVEKPDLSTAEQYLKEGGFLWNSGMFIWKVSTIIDAFREHLPAIAEAMESIFHALNTPGEAEALHNVYPDMQSISIDYGIMEKAPKVLTIPMDVQWNDVGCWSSLHGVWSDDDCGNTVNGSALCVESLKCVVSSPHKLTVLLGVDDLIIVDTPDALLVCRKDKAQDVKKLQDLLVARGYGDLL
ncbi:mannose-1-phosphate guanylyltransferase [Desulfomonile tiedjei]|uniref:mannose-1-phosphate guanylyltransferase n=1 Tax=Desulfomonile tiedjei (strain ATCC 49306 / DSM 6799 / DCB-1) TaxID=706587 RepID=I4C335_DESTA|nr:mannose-1-phosphate guanylyltransferase [Desulfomonile tiedjei]AFM23976.1 mannose-1-phosphate guanylyltransferase [Desulfomonile tiedjei DSM 6799]